MGLSQEAAKKVTSAWYCETCKADYCSACNEFTDETDSFRCVSCSSIYHYLCVGLTLDSQTKDWKCPTCKSGQPKTDNTNTPVKATTTSRKMDSPLDTEKPSNIAAFMTEMRQAFEELKIQQNNNYKELKASLVELTRQNSEFKDSVTFMSQQYDDMVKRMNDCDAERKNNLLYIHSLEDRIENLEKNLRSSSVEIRNVPQKKVETNADLQGLVQSIGNSVKLPIHPSDIRDVFRTPTKSEATKPIIVDFTSVILKQKLLESVKKFNTENKDDKLNSQTLNIDGPKKPIFVSENLTPAMRKLFFQAREFAKEKKFKFCWAAYGKIYLRQTEDCPTLRVESEAHLTKLRMADSK